MFLDFPENNNNALAPAELMPRGVGNTIITPTLHIPSLAFLVCYICIISRKTGKLPVEIVLILVSSLYLAISQNIKYNLVNKSKDTILILFI